jgi:hypothetical protein
MFDRGLVGDYKKPSVPEPLWNRAEELIEAHPELGYRNVSELLMDSFRSRIREEEERVGETSGDTTEKGRRVNTQ